MISFIFKCILLNGKKIRIRSHQLLKINNFLNFLSFARGINRLFVILEFDSYWNTILLVSFLFQLFFNYLLPFSSFLNSLIILLRNARNNFEEYPLIYHNYFIQLMFFQMVMKRVKKTKTKKIKQKP